MLKFNLLPVTLAALALCIPLESVHAVNLKSYVTEEDRLLNDREYYLDDTPRPDVDGGVNSDPTISPTQTTTVNPTAAPNVNPVATPVVTPSPTSSPIATSAVTTPSPTSSPIATPTTDDGGTNSDDPCADNGNGVFGNSSSDNVIIDYDYEMVTLENADVTATLLQLEDAIAAQILGSSYVTCLAPKLRRRKLALTGLSTDPKDRSTGDECSSIQDIGTNQCDVVEGRLTLFVDGNDVESHTIEIKQLIKDGMITGSLASTNEDIVELVYLEFDDTAVEAEKDGTSDRQATSGGGTYMALTLATASCAVVLLGFFSFKRMAKKEPEPEVTEDSENPGVEQTNDSVSAAVNGSHLNSSGSVTVTSFAQQSFGDV